MGYEIVVDAMVAAVAAAFFSFLKLVSYTASYLAN